MTIAVLGAGGQLGSELCLQLGSRAQPLVRADLDLLDSTAIQRVFRALRPSVVINSAAYTAVDKAERDQATCCRVNTEAVAQLAAICNELDCQLVQISTDYVFGRDVERSQPYLESDLPGPVNVYGATKLAAEAIAALCRRHLIVRTSGLYAAPELAPVRGRNFVDAMLSIADEQRQIRVVADQVCAPSYIPHVARAILFLLDQGCSGIYHVVNAGEVSWHRFAQEIFRLAGKSQYCVPITTGEYGAAAARPRYSALNTIKYQSLGGPPLPSWRSGIEAYFKAMPCALTLPTTPPGEPERI